MINKQFVRMDESEIVRCINGDTFNEADLVNREGWSHICRVRYRNSRKIVDGAWKILCRHRGYVLYRRNSRGF